MERAKDNLFLWYAKDFHRAEVLTFDVLQIGIFLIIRKGDTQHIRLLGDLVQQSTASQFDIVWVCAEEKDSFTEEVHKIGRLTIDH